MRENFIRLVLIFSWYLVSLILDGGIIRAWQHSLFSAFQWILMFPVGMAIGVLFIGWIVLVPALLLYLFNPRVSGWWGRRSIWTRRILIAILLGEIAAIGAIIPTAA